MTFPKSWTKAERIEQNQAFRSAFESFDGSGSDTYVESIGDDGLEFAVETYIPGDLSLKTYVRFDVATWAEEETYEYDLPPYSKTSEAHAHIEGGKIVKIELWMAERCIAEVPNNFEAHSAYSRAVVAYARNYVKEVLTEDNAVEV